MPIFIKVPFLHVKAITLIFIVLWKVTYNPVTGAPVYLTDRTKRHETLHWIHWLETYIIGFLPIYFGDWFVAFLFSKEAKEHPSGRFWGAYHRIRFEQEAYEHEGEPRYIDLRERNAWRYYSVISKD